MCPPPRVYARTLLCFLPCVVIGCDTGGVKKEGFCLLGDLRSDQLARAAPRREPVDNDDGVLGDGLLEGIGAGGHIKKKHAVSIVEPASDFLELQLQCQLQAAARTSGVRREPRDSRRQLAFALLGGARAGRREDNSRLNVVDSHLGQCGVE